MATMTKPKNVGLSLDILPDTVLRYLAHTESGTSIRAMARELGCHASTVMRQIRKVETQRDDPLVDEALRKLGQFQCDIPFRGDINAAETPVESDLHKQAIPVLRLLIEPNTQLVASKDMDKAMVIQGSVEQRVVIDRWTAEGMALLGWIDAISSGQVQCYRISSAGRVALRDMIAGRENRAMRSNVQGAISDKLCQNNPVNSTFARWQFTESPLVMMARRKDKHGQPFLTAGQVKAGERLQEDYEMVQLAGCDVDWTAQMLSHELDYVHEAVNVQKAYVNTISALRDLGPGLADIILKFCCKMQGMETVEKDLGWSARSGKIVLRIALTQLQRYYRTRDPQADLIT